MATAGDGAASYQGGGAGGKFRKRPIRRSAPATPYDRPPTGLRSNGPSLFAKLVDPASRLIYAGANRLFGVLQKRLPSVPAQRPPETNEEEPRNGLQEAGPNDRTEVLEPSIDHHAGNLASISAATEISELEHMLKQKTFTRSEIERLTALLHSRTKDPPSDDVEEGDGSKLPATTTHLLRLEASTSAPMNKHAGIENFHAAISTPVVNSRDLEENVASPAELAKAYMGTRPAKVSSSTLRLGSLASRQDSLLNNTTNLPKTPGTLLAPKTAGSFGGLENRFTTPRSRGRSAMFNMARTPYYRGPSTYSQKGINSDYGHGVASPSFEHEGSYGSSKMVLKRRSSVLDDDIGSGGPLRRIRQKAYFPSQGTSLSKHSQKLLLTNEPNPKEENGETSMRGSGYYASVPTKSAQMASKILEQLERISPKEKPSGSRLALRSTEKVDSPKLLLSPQDNQKLDDHTRESTSQGKDKVEETGTKKFAISHNVSSSMNGKSTVPVRDSPKNDSKLKMPDEPLQEKWAFQMSAHGDSSELDDNHHSNGHVPIPFVENKKLEKPLAVNKEVSPEANPVMLEVSNSSPPEVTKLPVFPEFKKTDFGNSSGSVLNEQKVGFSFATSSPPRCNDKQTAASLKEPKVFPTFGPSSKNDEKVPPLLFSANQSSGFKPNATPEAKPFSSTSLFNPVPKNDQKEEFPASKKDDKKPINTFGKSESLSSANHPTSPNGIFSFGASNGTPSNPSLFTTPVTTTNKPSNNIMPATLEPKPIFNVTSAPASAMSTPTAGLPETNSTKPNTFASSGSSPFGSTSTTSSNHSFQFGSSAPSSSAFTFGLTPAAPSTKPGTGLATNPFGSTVASFETKSNQLGSTLNTTPSFGAGTKSTTSGAASPTRFSFGASPSSASLPTGLGSGGPTFSFGAGGHSQGLSVFGNSTPNNNNNSNRMSMEDGMVEDPMQTASPPGPAGSPGGLVFGSGLATTQTAVFQFGGQANPFQGSGSVELSNGGSFSLGSAGGGEKSGRRILRASKIKNRRK